MGGNVVRKQNKRTLGQCRTHTATIEHYLEYLENMYRDNYPQLAEAMHVARELNSQLDDLIAKIDESI